MTSLPDPPVSKGMRMIAAYRAARLSERPVLRTTLRQTHAALRQTREQTLRPVELVQPQSIQFPFPFPEEPGEQAELRSDAGSVFAGLMTASITDAIPANHEVADEIVDTASVVSADVSSNSTIVDVLNNMPADPPLNDPPLAEIGFGPGMLIRLSQLGFHTMRDLAAADVSALRAGLGDISRLVNVETWVNNARDHIKTQ